MDKYDQMRKAEEIGNFLKQHRLRLGITIESEAERRGISVASLTDMEQGTIVPVLPVGMRVKTGGCCPGVGIVVEELANGPLIKFDDFEYPNAYFWFEVDPVDSSDDLS